MHHHQPEVTGFQPDSTPTARSGTGSLPTGHTFKVGGIEARVMFSPGHPMASITYVIGDAAFIHDTLFMPDSGTAHADFPGGSASGALSSNGTENSLKRPR